MFAELVLEAVRRRFPDLLLHIPCPERAFMAMRAPSPVLGIIAFYDDGDEVTVYAGDLTHGHFSASEEDSPSEREQKVVGAVLKFVEDTLEDRVLFWASEDRRSGGWTVLPGGSLPRSPSAIRTVWSGPLAPQRPESNAG